MDEEQQLEASLRGYLSTGYQFGLVNWFGYQQCKQGDRYKNDFLLSAAISFPE